MKKNTDSEKLLYAIAKVKVDIYGVEENTNRNDLESSHHLFLSAKLNELSKNYERKYGKLPEWMSINDVKDFISRYEAIN